MDHRNAHEGSQHNGHAKDVDLREDILRVKEALAQTANDVREKAEELFHRSVQDAKEKSNDIEENVVAYVKEHPLKTIGYSVLAGVILAKLLQK